MVEEGEGVFEEVVAHHRDVEPVGSHEQDARVGPKGPLPVGIGFTPAGVAARAAPEDGVGPARDGEAYVFALERSFRERFEA